MTALSSLVHTFGCRLNQFDGDALTRLLGERGFRAAEDAQFADVHIVNSCTITEQAKREAEKFSRKLARDYPHARIVWTGCAASSQEGQTLLSLPNVEMVIDNAQKTELPHRLANHLGLALAGDPTTPNELPVAPFASRSRALLKVQDGCDYRCSFCIVPEVRGKSRSVSREDIARQLDELLRHGAPEVVITGVHLGTWGRDHTPRASLTDLLASLLAQVERSQTPSRLRLSSIDPHEWTEQATQLFLRHENTLCRSLHLPTQSLCPDTLRRMRRAHRAEHFERAVHELTQAVPGIGIGTDIIAGHPGETRAHFDETFERLAKLALSYLHVFGYSERKGTAAAQFADPVEPTEKKRRVRALRELSAQMHERFARRACGREADVVVHLERPEAGAPLVGMTETFLKVSFVGPDALRGQRVRVRLEEPRPGGVWGTLVAPGWAGASAALSVAESRRRRLLVLA